MNSYRINNIFYNVRVHMHRMHIIAFVVSAAGQKRYSTILDVETCGKNFDKLCGIFTSEVLKYTNYVDDCKIEWPFCTKTPILTIAVSGEISQKINLMLERETESSITERLEAFRASQENRVDGSREYIGVYDSSYKSIYKGASKQIYNVLSKL